MKHIFLSFCVLLSIPAKADISKDTLDEFKTFAAKDLVNFGAVKGTTIALVETDHGLKITSGGEEIGNYELYERCRGDLENGDLKLTCYDGITASMDLCRIKPQPAICAGAKEKIREVYLDPNVSNGSNMRGLGKQKANVYMHAVTAIAKHYPVAKKAIAKAMEINGCSSVEIGDLEGSAVYMDQQALADEDTEELYENAVNRYRASLKCRTAPVAVQLDVVQSVEHGKVKRSLVPIRAVSEPEFVIDFVEPDFGKSKKTAANL